MYDYSRQTPYADFGTEAALGQRSAVLGKVLGLLGFAFVFTAGGALIGRSLGPGAFLLSIIGSFGTLIALQFLKERSPLNLGLLYAFATFEGMLLGLILDAYVARGLGGVVLNAAGTTAADRSLNITVPQKPATTRLPRLPPNTGACRRTTRKRSCSGASGPRSEPT